MVARWSWAWGSVSAGSDGECVEVVGEDCPPGPDLHSVVSFQSRSAHAVAAFEVADAPLDPGSVAGAAFAGASAAGFVAAGDLDLLVGQGGERGFGGAGLKAAVGDDLPGSDVAAGELGGGLGQERVLGWVPELVTGWEDQPASSLAGVFGDLADLRDVPELGRFAELALADRPGVVVGDRHQPVGDLQPADATVDLLGDLLRAAGELVQLVRGCELGPGAAPTG